DEFLKFWGVKMSKMQVGSGLVLALALAGPVVADGDARLTSRCERLLAEFGPRALKQCGLGTGGGAARGDFNADGFTDLAVGAPYENNGSTVDAGGVTVFYGSATGITATANLVIYGPSTNSHFGWALASGDFNGDGFSDLAAG